MKAYIVDNDQPSGVRFTEAADPSPAPNEAVIDVEAFSLNQGHWRGGLRDHGLLRDLVPSPSATAPAWPTGLRVYVPSVDAVLDAAGKGGLLDAIALAGGPTRVTTLADEHVADLGVAFSAPYARPRTRSPRSDHAAPRHRGSSPSRPTLVPDGACR